MKARIAETAFDDSAAGVVVGRGANFSHLRVRLGDGREVVAVLPAHRRFGCLFGSLVGWRARVRFPRPPRMPRVVDLKRPAEPPVAADRRGV